MVVALVVVAMMGVAVMLLVLMEMQAGKWKEVRQVGR